MTTGEGKPNIILTGFMATGKSSVGRRLAVRLGYDFLDLDPLIEAEAGMPISRIFASQGEAAFRSLEARMVERVAARRGCVVATGGGAILDPRNLEALKRNGVVIALAADPATILSRIGPGDDRPMLWGGEKEERIRLLLAERAPAYARADLSVDTSARTIDEVVSQIVDALVPRRVTAGEESSPPMDTIRVNLGSRAYDICVGANLLRQVGGLVRPLNLGPRLGVVTHPALEAAYGAVVVEALGRAGHEVSLLTVPPGEESKSPEEAARLSRALVRARLDRGSAILGLGGGVIGDLAGFVAATLYRGIVFINLPTTLLAQVDSSVGGKTGVNLPEGKNLVGAFHQPRLVVADVLTLHTLPEREFRSGLAEVVKHAMIADPDLFRMLEERADHILAREARTLQEIVAKSCAIKARVVEADERETDHRAILNFGHTVGHAIEAALGYGRITHGEAVAHGMLAAAMLSVRRGLCPERDASRLRELLARFELVGAPLPSPESLETYVVRDKKGRAGVLQFVLTRGVGSVTLAPVFDRDELLMALRGATF